MARLRLLCCLMCVVAVSGRKPLPSYIKACSLSDPNLEKCMLDRSNEVIPYIVKGDKEYKVPPFSPFKVESVKAVPGNNLQIDLQDVEIWGLEKTKLTKCSYDVTKHELFIVGFVPSVKALSDYKISGQLLVLPISGDGKLNITFEGVQIAAICKYNIVEKDGLKYTNLSIPETKFEESIQNMKIDLQNLFNGDKKLGDEMNKFLNENWKDAEVALAPTFMDIIKTIIISIINNIIGDVPYDEIILP